MIFITQPNIQIPDFLQNSTLFISARSPFARRVRLTFRLLGLNYSEKVFNVFQINPELNDKNPLMRVPSWQLNDGTIINDSNCILAYLYEALPKTHSQQINVLLNLSQKANLLNWTGLSVGLCEKSIEYFLEKDRPKEQYDLQWFDEIHRAIKQTLSWMNEHLKKGMGPIPKDLPSNYFTQANIDLSVALDYLNLRYGTQWQKEYAELFEYHQMQWQNNAAYRSTLPPPQ